MKSVYKQAVSAFFALMFAGTMSAQYIQKNLVANRHGYQEGHVDPNLVNGWGLAYLPGSPFWVADNFTGVSTLYTGQGATVPLVVTIPPRAKHGLRTGRFASGTGGESHYGLFD